MFGIGGEAKVVIVNYDILPQWLPLLKGLNPKWVIGDEIHMIGNLKTKRQGSMKGVEPQLQVPSLLGDKPHGFATVAVVMQIPTPVRWSDIFLL